ncbi:carbohydrate ABC transporter permease [Pseudonocardia sp. TRM90224]|uniref:carbohydrate ABC transporter permease n=1 Tax=Pseudonocardia sp. TRM90224 TaxID=2812678 RepID=UPI001E338E41|nr:sugar ABC transporter permease [Pseudonocardia sp. TRM90224]
MGYGKYRFIASFLALPLLLYVVFVVSPYVQAFYISMTDWRGFSANQKFIGLDNFVELAGDQLFWKAMWHNLLLLIIVPVVTLGIALFLATMTSLGGRRGLLARGGVRGSRFYQVVFFFPHVVPVVLAGVLFTFFYNPEAGLLNALLRVIGLDWAVRPWLGDTTFALPALTVVLIWGAVGFYYVLFSAAMKSVPTDVFEAATLDGAGRMRTFFSITLPMIWDSIQVSYIYLGITMLDGFTLFQAMLPEGGPDNSTLIVSQYLYRKAFVEGRFGYATAIGVALCLVFIVLAVVALRATRRERIEF